jgi:D-alanyl-D-alanine carboxypeptidase
VGQERPCPPLSRFDHQDLDGPAADRAHQARRRADGDGPNDPKIEGSSLHLKTWEKIPAQDLLYGLMLRSANDGSALAAKHVAGSTPKFAELMTRRAKELGALDSQFKNANGLPDPDHYTTAYDLAVITRAALEEPEFTDAVRVPRRTIRRSKNARDTTVATKGKRFYLKFPARTA